ncbi:hypothetical protein OSH11_18225 [Kaistia dalseonensis]|uniref:Precorrin-3B synthase n=1 Tax=Kaistia dalseonensis TaxID=410840 RepID=A0ABU0HCM1_9HYPH|nr:hypothetical protein [Kaistia dalseonensis]MCX5496648.1 hypothetical protein [Kaistia dalseonensis]MDQ0439271.1 precorrin-3B synthase [Kaistia dalseonensis]
MTITARNACPTLADPMRTGDGWLARLPPLVRPVTPDQLAGLAELSAAHGNGLVEISKRGNIQIRGLPDPAAAVPIALELDALGFFLPTGVPIAVDPLAAILAPEIDIAGIIDALHARLDQTGLTARLAPKVAILLDLGTAFHVGALTADLRLQFDGGLAHIGLGGNAATARWLGAVKAECAVDAAVAILERLATFGPLARLAGSSSLRDQPAFDAAIADLIVARGAPETREAARSIGRTILPPGREIEAIQAIAFPFGQATAADLSALAEAARNIGIRALAPAPERSLLLAGPTAPLDDVTAFAGRRGFIVSADDRRRFVSACIGNAGCASGHWPARAIASDLAQVVPGLFDGSFSLHLSGCAKGCAHPEPALITLAGIDKGAALVLQGRARDVPSGFVPIDALSDRLIRLGETVERLKRPGETVRSALERIGERAIIEALGEPVGDGSAQYGGKPRLFA